MSNRNTEEAWRYHNGTKHPDGQLMDRLHAFNPSRQPLLYKRYTALESIPLHVDATPRGVAALAAMRPTPPGDRTDAVPGLDALARLLHFSAGITKRVVYPWGELLFRAAACTGALYHIEVYVVCGDLPGLDAGVYHYDVAESALKRLRAGDYRHTLVDATAGEGATAGAPAILVFADVFWRNACKYQAREYRHTFWDAGTILAHTLAMAASHGLPARLVMGFVDSEVNRLLGLDVSREAAVALVPVGNVSNPPSPGPSAEPISPQVEPTSPSERQFPAILAMHRASSLLDRREVAAWRGNAPVAASPSTPGRAVSLTPREGGGLPQDGIEEVIVRRGSTRRFARVPITFGQLSTALERATIGIAADFLQEPGAALYQPYLIVNAVEGLEPGSYVYHRDRRALELLDAGEARHVAGHLGLGQELPADASVNIYFMCDLAAVLKQLGNRGYRAAQLDASIAAGRVYLAAYAQRIGATGLTFYDDAVTSFFSPHAQGKSVMFLVALGKKARRK